MKSIELEAWTLRVLESLRSGKPVEDVLVEIKSEWPDPKKAARRIAGHANAARGSPILWIVGADEKRGVKGAKTNELSSWYPQVEAEFDGVAPALDNHLNIPYAGSVVAALCFATDRAPYVVNNPAFNSESGGPVSLEVPWREGTRTRTANRSNLIQMLAPMQLRPSLELLRGNLHVKTEEDKGAAARFLYAYIEFYIAPRVENTTVFPFHRISVSVFNPQTASRLTLGSIHFADGSKRNSYRLPLVGSISRQQSTTVYARNEPLEITGSELILRGPRKIVLNAHGPLGDEPIDKISNLRFEMTLITAQGDMDCALLATFELRAAQDDKTPTWDAQEPSAPPL